MKEILHTHTYISHFQVEITLDFFFEIRSVLRCKGLHDITNSLPVNTMRRGKNMPIGDQYTPAILNRALSEKSRHPRPFFRISRLATRDSDLRFCGRATTSGPSRFPRRFLNIGQSRVIPRNCILVVNGWLILVLVFVPFLLVIVEICGKNKKFEEYTFLACVTRVRKYADVVNIDKCACVIGNVYRKGIRVLCFHQNTLDINR